MIDLAAPLVILGQVDASKLLTMFWLVIILDVPRYTMSTLAVFIRWAFLPKRELPPHARAYLDGLKLSVVIAGHNEAHVIRRCIRSIREQTRPVDEIIVVDDGSTDGMREAINELRREGLITMAISNQVRCGKPAAGNQGVRVSTGDIVIIVDADCSLDRDAIEKLIEPFGNPRTGATCGPIAVRNYDETAVTRWETIEYLQSICLGKRVLEMLNIVVCASGALSAFRRAALDEVGMMEPRSGEDFELTMRLRRAGWSIRFAEEAWCFTDVPTTLAGITRQRRRWDRDTIRTRLRFFRSSFNPLSGRFSLLETAEQIEWCALNLSATIIFPIYFAWAFYVYENAAVALLIFVVMIEFVLDLIGFTTALAVTQRFDARLVWKVAPYLLTYSVAYSFYLRFVRLYAYFEEWVYRKSREDSYVPRRVARQAHAR